MTITLQAPYGLIQATILLPSGNLGDSISPRLKVNIRNAMDGTIYSTIKTSNRVTLSWDLDLTLAKFRELDQFCEAYTSIPWRVYDWNDIQYKVILMSNPLQSTIVGYNTVNTRLEFEGFQIGPNT